MPENRMAVESDERMTRAQFTMQAAYLAKNAANWAGEIIGDGVPSDAIDPVTAARFIAHFRERLDRIETWAGGPAALRDAGTGRDSGEAAKVCHDDQMTVWSGEVASALSMSGYLRDDLSYDDRIDVDRVISHEIRSIVESAFIHPELIQTGSDGHE